MDDSISIRKQQVVQAALAQGLLGEELPLSCFLDLQGVEATVAELKAAFPDHFMHTFAAKANTIRGVLAQLCELGIGCEVASPGELEQAWRAGFTGDRIIYDEPAKTVADITGVLERNIMFNIDNFQEMGVVTEIRNSMESDSVIGVRINPQVGAGSIAAMSTATMTSKFGITLKDDDHRDRIIQAYKDRAWLTCIHCHVGSQGCALELMLAGIGEAVQLAEDINEAVGHQQVKVIDIGGGLTVNFQGDEFTPTYADYAKALEEAVPILFSGKYKVITEFGRSMLAKNGVIVAKVEYVKSSGGRRIALTHAGAQIATRTVFMPDMWPLRVSALDSEGRAKEGERVPQDVAGPCCFAGDIIAHVRPLPLLDRGDYVVIHDTGAYYANNPFYYNTLPAPGVYGFRLNENDGVDFSTIRPQQTMDQLLDVVG